MKKQIDLAGLVVTKGAAKPPPDMPARGDIPEPVAPAGEEDVPLNFRVPASFRKTFRIESARRDVSHKQLLLDALDFYLKGHPLDD